MSQFVGARVAMWDCVLRSAVGARLSEAGRDGGEWELRCVVAEDFVLRPEELIVPGAASVGPRTGRAHDVYFDTDDVRLAAGV